MPPKKRARQETVVEEVERSSPPPPPQYRMQEIFIQLNPPTFDGEGGPADAEDWIRSMERIFKFLQLTEKEMLKCAIFRLRGSADYWWEARMKFLEPTQIDNYTWKEFKVELHDKYVPKSYLREKEVEFYKLEQEMMSVTEYDGLFCELSRYAPQQVDTAEKMAKRFCAGLRPEIRALLVGCGGLSYAESFISARNIEAAMARESSSPTASMTTHTQTYSFKEEREWEGNWCGGSGQSHYDEDGGIHGQRRLYASNGKAENIDCFKCGNRGHFARQCPNR